MQPHLSHKGEMKQGLVLQSIVLWKRLPAGKSAMEWPLDSEFQVVNIHFWCQNIFFLIQRLYKYDLVFSIHIFPSGSTGMWNSGTNFNYLDCSIIPARTTIVGNVENCWLVDLIPLTSASDRYIKPVTKRNKEI